jgi:hypothetical protein
MSSVLTHMKKSKLFAETEAIRKKKELIQPFPTMTSITSYFTEKRTERWTALTMPRSRADKDKFSHLVSKMRKDWDLNEYKDFFSVAREQRRKHVFFVGPLALEWA